MKVAVLVLVVLALVCVASAAPEASSPSLIQKVEKTAAAATTTATKTETGAKKARTGAKTGARKAKRAEARAQKAAAAAAATTAATTGAAAKTTAAAAAAAPPVVVVATPVTNVNGELVLTNVHKKSTPGVRCHRFAASCAVCNDVHNCAWTTTGKCLDMSSPRFDAARAASQVVDACPQVVQIGTQSLTVPGVRRKPDIVEPFVGADPADPAPVVVTADVVAKLPVGVAILRAGNYSLIQNQSVKKAADKQGSLTPEFNN
jgi:hypothetical protein